jgi:hypothetical protein
MLPSRRVPRGDPEYLNVDLDLESREPPGRLADALPPLVVMLSTRMHGRYVMSLEGSWPTMPLLTDPQRAFDLPNAASSTGLP